MARVPFTISHAAAVLPFRKLSNVHLPLAAMMIGSMSPDFAYFLPGEFDRVDTHSIAGVFWFCWPMSLALWLLFVRVLEQPTSALLPENWRARFEPSDQQITLKALALASVAVMLGAVTHLIWDSFTHRGTAVVNALPGLHAVAFHIDGWRIRWFVVLQHVSSVFGILVLAAWAWRLAPGLHARPSPFQISHAIRIRAVAVIIAASFGLAFANFLFHADTWFVRRLFHLAIGGMTGLSLAWLGVSIWIRSRSPCSRI